MLGRLPKPVQRKCAQREKKLMKYTEEHDWLRIEGDLVVVGITEFTTEKSGDIVFVELPEPGKLVSRGDEIVVIESVKAASEISAMYDGEFVAMNEALAEARRQERLAAARRAEASRREAEEAARLRTETAAQRAARQAAALHESFSTSPAAQMLLHGPAAAGDDDQPQMPEGHAEAVAALPARRPHDHMLCPQPPAHAYREPRGRRQRARAMRFA